MSLLDELLSQSFRSSLCTCCQFELWLKGTDDGMWAEYVEARDHPRVPHTGLWAWCQARWPEHTRVQSKRYGEHRNHCELLT